MKLLLHICCAPCSAACIKVLREEEIDVTGYWYNPNIHPKVEYERRKNAFIEFCKIKEVKNVVIDEYNLNEYVKYIALNVGEDKKYKVRCEYCYYIRLKKVFEYAKENNFDVVSTTLTISPYQNNVLIKKFVKELQDEYCGCVFSFDAGRWVY